MHLPGDQFACQGQQEEGKANSRFSALRVNSHERIPSTSCLDFYGVGTIRQSTHIQLDHVAKRLVPSRCNRRTAEATAERCIAGTLRTGDSTVTEMTMRKANLIGV